MKINEYVDEEELDTLIKHNIIKRSRFEDLYIYSYTQKCTYKKQWNDVTIKCRGVITDLGGNIKAIPMKKFFNVIEHSVETVAEIKRTPFEVYEKIDGCLVILYYYNNELYLSTKGKLNSEQAIEATKYLRGLRCYEELKKFYIDNIHEKYTIQFEYISPSFPIIIDYHGETSLSFLGATEWENQVFEPNNRALGQLLDKFKTIVGDEIKEPVQFNTSNWEAVVEGKDELNSRDEAEGLILYVQSMMVKVKQQDYIELTRLHKIVNAHLLKSLLERSCGNPNILRVIIDEEYKNTEASLIFEKIDPYFELYNELDEEANELFNSTHIEVRTDRARFATYFHMSPFKQVLISLLDKRPKYEVAQYITRMIKIKDSLERKGEE